MTDTKDNKPQNGGRFDDIGPGTWFATYNPETNELALGFDGRNRDGRQFFEIALAADQNTGATWLQVDGRNVTVEDISKLGRFTIPLSAFLYSVSPNHRQEWVYGDKNIQPLEAMLVARGDEVSAQKLRETFPKLFFTPEPPAAPIPQTKPSRRRFWQRS